VTCSLARFRAGFLGKQVAKPAIHGIHPHVETKCVLRDPVEERTAFVRQPKS
jgi:hypothetical protein